MKTKTSERSLKQGADAREKGKRRIVMPRKTKRSRWQIEMSDSDLKNCIRAFRRILVIYVRLRQNVESWTDPFKGITEDVAPKSFLLKIVRRLGKLQQEAQKRNLKIPRRKEVESIIKRLMVR